MKRQFAATGDRFVRDRHRSTGIAGRSHKAGLGTRVVNLRRGSNTSSTSLHPFAPRVLARFRATTGALTPGWPALRTGRLTMSPAHEHRPVSPPGLPVLRRRTFRPFRLQPPLAAPEAWFVFLRQGLPRASSLARPHRDRRDHSVTWASPLGSRLATTTGRIEFVILRTGRSPPVALHLLSRERSYHRLQNPNLTLTRTFTSRIQRAHRRTATGSASAVVPSAQNTGTARGTRKTR